MIIMKHLFRGSLSSVKKILKEMKFVWSKGNPYTHVRESDVMHFKRSYFLREYIRNVESENPKPIVFLDETWIFMNGSPTYSWSKPSEVSSDMNGIIRRPTNEGGRLDAGTKGGFILGADLIFSCN